jgi:hypothetical protein
VDGASSREDPATAWPARDDTTAFLPRVLEPVPAFAFEPAVVFGLAGGLSNAGAGLKGP